MKQFYEGLVQTITPSDFLNNPVVAPIAIQYYNTMVQADKNQWIDSECAEIAFLNVGDGNFPTPTGASVVILGFTIKPGFGISFDGNEHEIDMTKYYIQFIGAGVKNCSVFRKMFR